MLVYQRVHQPAAAFRLFSCEILWFQRYHWCINGNTTWKVRDGLSQLSQHNTLKVQSTKNWRKSWHSNCELEHMVSRGTINRPPSRDRTEGSFLGSEPPSTGRFFIGPSPGLVLGLFLLGPKKRVS